MRLRILFLALPFLLLVGNSIATAQWPRPAVPPPGDLSGPYVNTSNDGPCEVYRRGRDYIFINENGTRACFRFVGPGELRMVSGGWNPDTIATVGTGRDGRPFIRFQEPGQRPGYWVRTD